MKKIKYILVILLFTLCINVNATECERTPDNNYGVNKKINIDIYNLEEIKDTKCVDASKKVYDYADILTDEEESELRYRIQKYSKIAKMDAVIVTIDIPNIDYERFAADFYDFNDFGIDYTNYSGTLLLRNVSASNRFFNIYAFGEAQRYYDYDRMNIMLDDMHSDLSYDRNFAGLAKYIKYIGDYYNSGIPSNMYNTYVDDKGIVRENFTPIYIVYAVIGLTIAIIVICIYVSKNKMVKLDTYADQYLDRNSIDMDVKKDTLVSSHTTHYRVSNNSSSGGSSGGFSGGSHIGSSGLGHTSGSGRHG